MDIIFEDKKLKKCADGLDELRKEGKTNAEITEIYRQRLVRLIGETNAGIYLKRLTRLIEAKNLEEMRNTPGKWHELLGNRKGYWACSLENPKRLLIKPQEKPIPEKDGKYIWGKIKGVCIVGIEDYHK